LERRRPKGVDGETILSNALLAWFTKRREAIAIKMVQEHLALTAACVDEFRKSLNLAFSGSGEAAIESIKKLARLEMEADSVRRKIIDEVAKGELPASDREDLMHLVRAVDWVADWARESGRILTVMMPLPANFIENFSGVCSKMAEAVQNCTEALRKCIGNLGVDSRQALAECDEVERAEERVDELYENARLALAKARYQEGQVGCVVLFAQFLDAIEMVADWCENTADEVRVLSVRGK